MGSAASRKEKSMRRLPVDRDSSKPRDLKSGEEETQFLQGGSIIKLPRKKDGPDGPNESRVHLQQLQRRIPLL